MGEINLTYKTKPFVLTGGPGVGKTMTAIGLELKGYFVIPEVAESYIKLQQHLGDKYPWEDKNFEAIVLRYQLQKESVLKELRNVGPVFIDRGNLDALAYYQYYDRPISPLMKQVIACHEKTKIYNKIFLLEQLGGEKTTEIRKENSFESKSLELLQEKNYRDFGYEVIRIPALPLAERVKLVISKI